MSLALNIFPMGGSFSTRKLQLRIPATHGAKITKKISFLKDGLVVKISYCPKSRLAPVFSILVPDPL